MDDREIRDQLMTLLLAGHETTATGLAWTFDLLLRHPHVLERLVAAVDAGERRVPARGRRRVAAAAPGRPARRPPAERASCASNGHVLPPGTDVTPGDLARPHARRTATRSRTRSAPSASSTSAPATYAWIPFGGGVRRCLGAAFAEMEMRVVLAEILAAAGAAAGVAARPSASRGAT